MAKKVKLLVSLDEYEIIWKALNELRSRRIQKGLYNDYVDDALFGVFKKKRKKKKGDDLYFKLTERQQKVTAVALKEKKDILKSEKANILPIVLVLEKVAFAE